MSDLFSIVSKWGVSSLFRIMLPGFALALLMLPLVNPLVPLMLRIDELADLATVLLPEVLILGLLFTLLRSFVYRIYEGRLLWPQWLHQNFTGHINNQVKKRLAEAEKLDASSVQYKELWYWLRMFPLDNRGDPAARRPTMLGNILEGYEEYSLRRYGMDSIFYWYRLWPTLPESFVKQMDQASAEADCLMYISFSSLVMGLIYTLIAIARWVMPWMANVWPAISPAILNSLNSTPSWGAPAVWAIGCLTGGYVVYRISLPLHRRNGEFFKTAFDLYRSNVVEMTKASQQEKAKWRQAWSYLQYMYIQCPHCERYCYAEEEKCPHCGKPRELEGEAGIQEEKRRSTWLWDLLSRLLLIIGIRPLE